MVTLTLVLMVKSKLHNILKARLSYALFVLDEMVVSDFTRKYKVALSSPSEVPGSIFGHQISLETTQMLTAGKNLCRAVGL